LDLTRELPGDKVFVRSVDANGITIAGQTFTSSLILSPDAVKSDWTVCSVEELNEEALQPVLRLEPELVILGTGQRQSFLAPALMMLFHRAGVGIEVMDTRAACRTFNILVLEERKVVAALLPPN
jgi:uncharacterized protein